MQYELVVDVERTITEQYNVTVSAEDEEEALDLAHEYFSEYPNSTFSMDRLLKTREATENREVRCIEFKKVGLVQDGVFSDNDSA